MNGRGLLLLGATLLTGLPAVAQQPAPAPASDPATVWTLQGENASISTAKLTDRYYTNGLRLSWTSAPDMVPEALRGLGNKLWGPGEARMSIDITQQMYNAADTTTNRPPPGDRPFAGVLMANFALVQDSANTRSSMTVGVGVVGPASGAEGLQNGFHRFIGQNQVYGWGTQLKNEPLLQITSQRTWRVPIAQFWGVETDALPELTASVGNLRVYLQTGALFRIGQGLQSDFGPVSPRPGVNGGDYFRKVRDVAWYFFAGLDGRAVEHDLTLDGNTWQNSRHTNKHAFVGQMQTGFALIAYGMRLSYTHKFTTQEFVGQHGGLHQMGALALSVRF